MSKARLIDIMKQVSPPPREPTEQEIADKLIEVRAHAKLGDMLKRMLVARYEPTGVVMLVPRFHDYSLEGLTVIDDYATVELTVAKIMLDGQTTMVELRKPGA